MHKIIRITVSAVIICLFCRMAAGADGARPAARSARRVDSRHVDFGFAYKFRFPRRCSKLQLTVQLPVSIPRRQDISEIKFSRKPLRDWMQNGQRYASFRWLNPQKEELLTITGQGEIFRYDLLTARRGGKVKMPEKLSGLQLYLEPGKDLEVNAEPIRKIAPGLKKQRLYDTLKNIHRFVVSRLSYKYMHQVQGALWALEHKTGDCDEFAALFITLCRANGLPARWVCGYGLDRLSKTRHTWAEVYLDDYGWVPFDPAFNKYRNSNFAHLQPIYLCMSHTLRDAVLQDSSDFYYYYEGAPPTLQMSFTAKSYSAGQANKVKIVTWTERQP